MRGRQSPILLNHDSNPTRSSISNPNPALSAGGMSSTMPHAREDGLWATIRREKINGSGG